MMSLIVQLSLGTALLVFCALVHVAAVAICAPVLPRIAARLAGRAAPLRNVSLLTFGLVAIVVAHTIEIWSWALTLILVGAFEEFERSFYFATVTYTTLGYGDIVLSADFRIFGTFASITGLLTFGISTALLIGIVLRLLPGSRHYTE